MLFRDDCVDLKVSFLIPAFGAEVVLNVDDATLYTVVAELDLDIGIASFSGLGKNDLTFCSADCMGAISD